MKKRVHPILEHMNHNPNQIVQKRFRKQLISEKCWKLTFRKSRYKTVVLSELCITKFQEKLFPALAEGYKIMNNLMTPVYGIQSVPLRVIKSFMFLHKESVYLQ